MGGLFQEGVGAWTERPVRAGLSTRDWELMRTGRSGLSQTECAAAVASAGLGVWVPKEQCSLQGTWWFHCT